jgi:hypothetical protein
MKPPIVPFLISVTFYLLIDPGASARPHERQPDEENARRTEEPTASPVGHQMGNPPSTSAEAVGDGSGERQPLQTGTVLHVEGGAKVSVQSVKRPASRKRFDFFPATQTEQEVLSIRVSTTGTPAMPFSKSRVEDQWEYENGGERPLRIVDDSRD